MKVNLSMMEIRALISTAENMRDEIDYFKDLYPPKEYKQFCEAYETALEKLKTSLFKLDSILRKPKK